MDHGKLKKAVERIEMTDAARMRITESCISKSSCEREENRMNENVKKRIRKPAVLAAAVVLCICLAVGVSAAGGFGFFKDVTAPGGAVIGTVYKNAEEEIRVNAAAEQNILTVYADFLYPDEFPYRELECFGIGKYSIVDESGRIIEEGGQTELFDIANGSAEIRISMKNDASYGCKLIINSFVGGKKADQNLPIEGVWECALGNT